MAKYIYTCFECGFPFAFDEEDVPDKCPACSAPKEKFLKEPWTGSIETRRIHVDPPAPDENRDPHDISFHIAKNFMLQKGHGRIRRWIMAYDDPEVSKKFYTEQFGWDIVDGGKDDSGKDLLYCATGPGTPEWEPSVPSFGYGYLVPKREGRPDYSFVVEVKDIPETLKKAEEYGGKTVEPEIHIGTEKYALIKDSEGNELYLWEIPGTRVATEAGVNPGRPPKRYTQKSLHGRTRIIVISYKEFRRFQDFYLNVFGWDMMELPEATSRRPVGDPHPGLLCATGPSQTDYEGAVPGHMNAIGIYSELDGLEKIGTFMEISMDAPLEETIGNIVDAGGTLIKDRKESFYAKELDDSKQSWEPHAVVDDPAGNRMYLWKCPSSRTWEELETGYDKD